MKSFFHMRTRDHCCNRHSEKPTYLCHICIYVTYIYISVKYSDYNWYLYRCSEVIRLNCIFVWTVWRHGRHCFHTCLSFVQLKNQTQISDLYQIYWHTDITAIKHLKRHIKSKTLSSSLCKKISINHLKPHYRLLQTSITETRQLLWWFFAIKMRRSVDAWIIHLVIHYW